MPASKKPPASDGDANLPDYEQAFRSATAKLGPPPVPGRPSSAGHPWFEEYGRLKKTRDRAQREAEEAARKEAERLRTESEGQQYLDHKRGYRNGQTHGYSTLRAASIPIWHPRMGTVIDFDVVFDAWEAIADRDFDSSAEAEGFRDGYVRVFFDNFASNRRVSKR